MPVFHFSAYTPAGRIETGTIEASSSEDVLGALATRGLTPFETRQVNERGWKFTWTKSNATFDDIAHMTRELATLLEAEIPVDEALRLLSDQTASTKTKTLVGRLLSEVMGGASLSIALERQGSIIPSALTSLVRAGEARGTLGSTLAEIARLLEGQAEVRARIKSALVYPLVLAGIALVTLGIILTVLFPSLLQLFEDSRAEPPFILAFARDTSDLFSRYGPVLVPACSLLGLGFLVALQRAAARGALDRLLVRLPVVGDLKRKLAIAAFARTLGSLVRNGVQLLEALSITAAAVPSTALASHLRAAADALKEGRRLSEALAIGDILPRTVTRLITIGEESSRLDTMLLHLADMYDRDASRALERAMTLLSPLITVIVGILVGGIILSVMQAVLSINTLALR
jgi:general secretion pathway protein F